MGLSGFSGFLMFLLLFFGDFQVGLAESNAYREKYISWDDLKVDKMQIMSFSGDENHKSRIIVVDKNGGGDSVTVQGAVDIVHEDNTKRVKIFILPGIYREKVFVPRNKPYVSFIGDENRTLDTVISWNNKASDTDENGNSLGTCRSATVAIESDYFCAAGITFELEFEASEFIGLMQNTVMAVPGGDGMQAVAVRIAGDKAMFYRVRVLGDQDTLLDESGTHYFYKCHIQGSVDFIFGRSKSLYQHCIIISTAKNYGAIAAHHRDSPNEDTGFSFVHCKIDGTGDVFLGRAWGNYSRAIYSYCYMTDIINPHGWSDWNYPTRERSAVFGEFRCRGKGANTRGRVPWSKTFTAKEAKPFLDLNFINGDQWLRL